MFLTAIIDERWDVVEMNVDMDIRAKEQTDKQKCVESSRTNFATIFFLKLH